jgi:16S rRNA (cytidine1402-2'-O)-methyltransferase
MPTLYMVATPIGNLADITFRALEVLKSVDLIVCEDTRHSRRLLDHYGVQKPLRSGHGHNEARSALGIVGALRDGSDVAYLTDAGVPGISDPGRVMVRTVRDAGFPVVPIPGASALTALLSVNGLPGKAVTFEGFLSPRQGRRRKRLSELLDRKETFVLYESPHRLLKLLADLADLDPERPVLLGRELTKIHEELLEGTASEVLATMTLRQSIKGELVLLVSPPKKAVNFNDLGDDD